MNFVRVYMYTQLQDECSIGGLVHAGILWYQSRVAVSRKDYVFYERIGRIRPRVGVTQYTRAPITYPKRGQVRIILQVALVHTFRTAARPIGLTIPVEWSVSICPTSAMLQFEPPPMIRDGTIQPQGRLGNTLAAKSLPRELPAR